MPDRRRAAFFLLLFFVYSCAQASTDEAVESQMREVSMDESLRQQAMSS